MEAPVLVIGVGNEYRGDDKAGLAVVRTLQARQIENVRLMESDGDCTVLLEAWKGADKVILIDAASSGARPGTIHRFEAQTQALPEECTLSSTHAFGIAETLRLARVLGQLPPRLIVYGIEGKRFTTGDALSPAVRRAIQKVADRILIDIQDTS